jgi:hypothetical protein
MKFEKV